MITKTTVRHNEELVNYLTGMGAIGVIIDLAVVLSWIRDYLGPEDVFSYRTLEDWAESYGYIDDDSV